MVTFMSWRDGINYSQDTNFPPATLAHCTADDIYRWCKSQARGKNLWRIRFVHGLLLCCFCVLCLVLTVDVPIATDKRCDGGAFGCRWDALHL